MYKLSLAHIYPNLLNFYGDTGNVIAIKKRCEWRGIDIDIINVNVEDDIPTNCDIYFLGGALPNQQILATNNLKLQKKALTKIIQNNSIILAISEGFQLLGEYYQYKNQEKINGLNILDIYSIEKDDRFVGNVTTSCDFLSPCELVGFENHTMQTYIKTGTKEFSNIIIGKGNNNTDKTEGARKNNIFGTHLHGAFLPKNPHFTDYLIKTALENKYKKEINLTKLNDEIEENTHKKLVGKKY